MEEANPKQSEAAAVEVTVVNVNGSKDVESQESSQKSGEESNSNAEKSSNPNIPDNVPAPRFMQRSTPQKAHEYDFIAARSFAVSPNTMCESIAHMIKVFLAGGVFAMHAAFSKVGVTTGVIGLILVAFMVGSSMCSVVSSAQKLYGRVHLSRLSYPDLAEASLALSPWGVLRKSSKCFRYSIEFILMFHLICTCAVYQIMIARALKQLVDRTIEDIYSKNFERQKMYILGTITPCLLVVMVRHLRNLAPFAVVIDLYANMAALVTIYYGVHGDVQMDMVPTIRSIDGLFQFIGICLFSLQAVSVSLVIENNMAEPKSFRYVVFGSLPYAISIMMIIGAFGYWGFGEKTVAPITVLFPWTHFPIMTKVFLCIVMYITYAEVFYFGFDIQWYYLKRFYQIRTWWIWERLYRAINVIFIAMIAYAFPNVSKTMGLLGCCFASVISLMVPAFIELIVDWEYPGPGRCHWKVLKFVLITVVGCIICVVGTYYNWQHISVTFYKKR